MALFPFIGQTYPATSPNINCSRAINLFPEINLAESASKISLVGTPGTSLFTNVGLYPVRGARVFNNNLFVVSGNSLYSIDTAGNVSASLGALNSFSGFVSMADNGLAASGIGGNQLMITDGVAGYLYNVITGVFTTISGGWWPGATGPVTFIDGYFVTNQLNSMNYGVSNLYDGSTWNALATSPVMASSDNIQCPINTHQQLLFIKTYTSEFWYDSGTATSQGSPFLRISGGVIDFGTEAPFSPAVGDNSLFWLASQRNQDSAQVIGVAELSGTVPQIVSTVAINYQIQRLPAISDAIGYCYNDGGHTFYVLTFPQADWTIVYDSLTQQWHERNSYRVNAASSIMRRHVGNCYAYFNRKHYVGDWQNGNIYEMSQNYYTDNGNPIIGTRIAQPLSMPALSLVSLQADLDNIFCKSLVVDAEMGREDLGTIWNDNSLSGSRSAGHFICYSNAGNAMLNLTPLDLSPYQSCLVKVTDSHGKSVTGYITGFNGTTAWIGASPGASLKTWLSVDAGFTDNDPGGITYSITPTSMGVPLASLSWSDDGGHTWSNEYPISLGKTGEYRIRLKWRRLGKFRSRTFRLDIDAPVKRVLINGFVEVHK